MSLFLISSLLHFRPRETAPKTLRRGGNYPGTIEMSAALARPSPEMPVGSPQDINPVA
jgi:hypothetical protein